ncbi:MAG: hypothetical protein Q8N56_00325 [bacterium]|nr:hypothetical protein [bacterium]
MEMLMTMPQILEPEVSEAEKAVEEVVELVIPPSANATQLFKFMNQLSNELACKDSSFMYGDILHTHGRWNQGVVITMSVWRESFDQFLEGLTNITGVLEVEEEPLINLAFLGMTRRPEMLPSSHISPSKRVHLALGKGY